MFCTTLRSRPFGRIVPSLQSSLGLKESRLTSHDLRIGAWYLLLVHPIDLSPGTIDTLRHRLEHFLLLGPSVAIVLVLERDVEPMLRLQDTLLPLSSTVNVRLASGLDGVVDAVRSCGQTLRSVDHGEVRPDLALQMASVLPSVSTFEAGIVMDVFKSLGELGRACAACAMGKVDEAGQMEQQELRQKMELLMELLGQRTVRGFVQFWMEGYEKDEAEQWQAC